MGLGEALMEEQAFRRLPKRLSNALVHKFPSMLEYKSPTSLDMPEIFTELVENPDPHGPFGAKEVGQGPLLPIMPALANAVYDAVGVRIDEVPITPEKIVKALAEKAAGRTPRYGPSRFPDVDWPEPLQVPPPWEGGTGRASDSSTRLKPRTTVSETRTMMRLPRFEYRAPATLAEAARRSCRSSRRRDGARRRHRSPAEHEAPAADASRAREPAPDRGAESRTFARSTTETVLTPSG